MKNKLIQNQIRFGIFLFLIISITFITQCSSPLKEPSTENINVLNDILEVHFINVGHGDSILIEENDDCMLIDAGKSYVGDDIVEYLKSENITDLDYVIATHPHVDHIGGMDSVLEAFPVGRIIMPDVPCQTKTYENLLNEIKDDDIAKENSKVGESYSLGLATFTILAPNSTDYKILNNYSICIRLTYGNSTFLFTGDAETLSEKEMLDSGMDLSADVLKVGHHGASNASSDEFVKAVNPDYAVISVGSQNEYGLPRASILRELYKDKIDVYRTDKQGTIVFNTDGNSIYVNTSPYKITKADLKSN